MQAASIRRAACLTRFIRSPPDSGPHYPVFTHVAANRASALVLLCPRRPLPLGGLRGGLGHGPILMPVGPDHEGDNRADWSRSQRGPVIPITKRGQIAFAGRATLVPRVGVIQVASCRRPRAAGRGAGGAAGSDQVLESAAGVVADLRLSMVAGTAGDRDYLDAREARWWVAAAGAAMRGGSAVGVQGGDAPASAGWREAAATTSRTSGASSRPNPPTSPGVSDKPCRVSAGTVMVTSAATLGGGSAWARPPVPAGSLAGGSGPLLPPGPLSSSDPPVPPSAGSPGVWRLSRS